MPRNTKKNLARCLSYNAKKSSEKIQQLSQRKAPTRCDKAIVSTVDLRDRSSEAGSICMPDVAIYAAGYRNSKNIMAR